MSENKSVRSIWFETNLKSGGVAPVSGDVSDESMRLVAWDAFRSLVTSTDEPPETFRVEWEELIDLRADA